MAKANEILNSQSPSHFADRFGLEYSVANSQESKICKVCVTAFPDMAEFKRHSSNIAWETEVWLMDMPDHMIHFNGDRFMGPR